MTRFHVGKSGRTAICRAKEKCPLGDVTEHTDSREAAQVIVDSYNENVLRLENGEDIVLQTNPYVTAGQIKALKERNKELRDSISKAVKEENEFYEKAQQAGFYQMTERVELSRIIRDESLEALPKEEKKLNELKSKVKELMNNQPFGDRFVITKNGKYFVNNITKDEWNDYNKLKNQLNSYNKQIEIQQKEVDYHNKILEDAKTDEELNSKLEEYNNFVKENPFTSVESIEKEIQQNEDKIEILNISYGNQILNYKYGKQFSDLTHLRENKDAINNVTVDDNGNFANVYARQNNQVYKVLNNHRYGILVEDMSGKQHTLAMSTNYNWKMGGSKEDKFKSLPQVFIDENDTSHSKATDKNIKPDLALRVYESDD